MADSAVIVESTARTGFEVRRVECPRCGKDAFDLDQPGRFECETGHITRLCLEPPRETAKCR